MKKLLRNFALSLSLLFAANVYSANIVGYYNLALFPGDNLIANQLDNGTNNLNSLFVPGNVPVGTTFTKWDSSANAFLPVSTFTGSSWTINYDLHFGEGGLLRTTSSWTNIFVGSVYPAAWLGAGGTNIWQPNYADGLHLISSPIPLTSNMDVMFTNVVGRLPQNGESVRILNPATQTYLTTTFYSGFGWDNGNPTLQVGQSAWFNLGAVVPEPGSMALVGLGLVTGAVFRRRRLCQHISQAIRQQFSGDKHGRPT